MPGWVGMNINMAIIASVLFMYISHYNNVIALKLYETGTIS
jgi:hypothetical protein